MDRRSPLSADECAEVNTQLAVRVSELQGRTEDLEGVRRLICTGDNQRALK